MQSSTAQSPLSPFSLSGNQDGFQLDDIVSPLSSSKKEMRDGDEGFDPTPSNSTPSIPSMDQISPLPLQPESPHLIPTNRIPSLSDSNLDRHNDLNEASNHISRSTSPSPLHPDPRLDHNHFSNSRPSASTSKRKLASTNSSHHHQESIPHHARFVTASAILSRSGAIYPIPNRFESESQQGTSSNTLFDGNWNVNWSGIGNQNQQDRELEGTTDDQAQDLYMPSSNQNELGSGLRRKSTGGKRSGMERSRSLGKKPKSKGRGTSNGSALEAFSALLLHKETKGKVSNLSFTKDHNESEEEDEEESSILKDSNPNSVPNSRRSKKFNKPKELNLSRASSSTSSYTVGSLTDWVSNDWLEKVRLAGATRLGLMLPHQNDFSRRRRKEKGTPLTIAERRAKKLGLETPLTGTSKFLDQSFRFCRVGTRYGEPVYQLEKPPKVRERERDGKSNKAKGRILIDGFEMNETGEVVEKEGNNSTILEKEKEEKEKGSSSETYDQMQFNPRSTLPPNTRLLLKRSRKDSPSNENGSQQFSNSSFGIGSAQISLDLPEAPPSPLGMPGAWSGSSSWSWSFRTGTNPNSNSRFQEDFAMEGALLLPPPLLDDGSDRNSFEGLLGIKRQRELEKKRKESERLRARNRPDHKVGMFTAMTNFVKAAHAAEKSAKNSKLKQKLQSDRPGLKDRSFTEPIQSRRRGSLSKLELRNEMDLDADLDFESKTPIYATHQESQSSKSNHDLMSPLNSHDHLGGISSSPMARRTSASSREDKKTRRRLNTSSAISSSSTSSSEEEEEEIEALESLDKVSEELSSSFSSLGDLPRAPRLLPVQLSVPPSPSTPLIGVGSGSSSSSRRSSISDYISSRTSNDISIAPRTPRLGPTLMSLPPSPWVHSSSQSPPPTAYHFHLNTTSVNGPPGTPKLIPTHLEVLPSPFPTPSVSNHRSSFSFTQPSPLRMTNLIDDSIKPKRRSISSSSASSSSSTKSRSPRTSFQFDPIPSAPMVLSPTQLAADAKPIPSELLTQSLPSTPTNDSNSLFGSNGRKKGKNLLKGSHPAMNSPGRLTPASMLADLSQNDQVVSSPILTSPPPAPRLGPRPAEFQPLSPIMAPINRRRSLKHNGENGSLPNQNRKGSSTSVRSNSQSSSSPRSARQRSFLIWFLVGDLWLDTRSKLNINSTKSGYLGGIAGFTFHFLNFVIFILAHLLAFIYELSETFSLTFWFLRWIILNLTGRTVLSRCLIEAHALISNEWKTVSLEDHENRGNHEKRIGNEILKKPKGLTKFQVLRGLAELAALQNVTRERYLSEGAGLIKLEGWRKEKRRRAKDGSRRSESQSFELEKTKLRPVDENVPQRGESYNSLDSLDSKDDEEEEGEEVTSSSSDEDEGDIVVTNQGQDILELAKTPRIHPVHGSGMRPSMNGRNPSGYFAENVPLDQKKREKRGIHFGQDPTWSEDPRLLMKTIKWASRLAISAYGLHVHIVDLPPTFTPSGERFSRQTFAHLSRLNAEDVLHADIQTLDSEAAYTPTFYVVRDYARKVVVVAVRGTQSFSDIIIDLEMQTDRVDLRDIGGISSESDEPLLCHAGILRAARALVARDSTLLDTLQAALEENEDFGVCLTGHSLGGSVAAVAALLLSEYNTEGIQDGNTSKGRWLTSSSSGLPSKRPIRAITFAPPATVSAALAQRASLGIVPLVTTAVLGSDIIPRAGHGQARELRRVLGALSRVRRRHESAFTSSSPSESEDDARVHIIKSWWDWRSICMAVKPDAVMLHRKDRIEEQLWKLRCDVEADLYAAVKSRHDESSDFKPTVGRRSTSSSSSSSSSTSFSNSRSKIPPSPWVGPQQRAKAPLHQLATRRQAIDAATLRSEAAQGVLPVLFPAGRSIWISGSEIYVITSPLAFFSLPDLHPSMFAEHFPSAYESAFEDLPI